MLELPESYTIAKQINELLTGKIISHIEILKTPHKFAFFHGAVDKYEEYLEGQTITGAVFQGGMVQINTEDSMIVLNDGAYPRYYDDTKNFPKKHQFAIYFEDETGIFVSIQMYGGITVYPKGECTDEYYRSSSTKPNPLTDGFTFDYFKSLYPVGKKLSAKAFLATQQRIPGLGNGVLQDILWEAGIDPRYPMQDAPEEDFRALYDAANQILKAMADKGGRDTERDLFGQKGNYITQLSKNSLNEPCIRCGCEIHKTNYMGGTIYFCERCQRR